MQIELITTWKYSGSSNFTATGTGICFDTDTKEVGYFGATVPMSILSPLPPDTQVPAGTMIWFECAGTTEKQWYFDGVKDVYTKVVQDSTSCGYIPPVVVVPLTCDLVLTADVVGGDKIVASATGGHGTVTFSLDGGVTRQLSGTFPNLLPSSYVVTAYDEGVNGCQRSLTRFVTAAVPTVLPVAGTLPQVSFSRNPIALLATATLPGRALLVELWAESSHGSGKYTRLVQRVRPTDAKGQAVLQLQDQLHAVLTPERPDLTRPAGLVRLTSAIRRYYATVAEVQPANGLPGPAVFEPASTVLRGGLAWAQARAGTFFNPLPARLLTWRPDVREQVVGQDHVGLLTRLLPAGTTLAQARVRCYERGITTPFATRTYDLALPAIGMPGVALDPPTPFLVQLQLPLDELPAGTYRVEADFVADGVRQAGRGRYRLEAGRYRHYLFLNSLGQWDTLSCPHGTLTNKTTTDRTVATRLVPADYDPQDGPEAVVSVQVDTKMTVSTGPVSPVEQAYLRELLTSTDVYEVNSGRQLRKIRLTTKDFIDYKDNAGADGLAFEYNYCFDTSLFDNDRITNL
jgi:hypothetical protein